MEDSDEDEDQDAAVAYPGADTIGRRPFPGPIIPPVPTVRMVAKQVT